MISMKSSSARHVLHNGRGSHLSTAQEQWHYLPAILHALSIGGIVRHTVTVSSALGLEIDV